MMVRKPDHEAGTVLITTLMIMAVMAALAVAIMDDIKVAVRRTANIQAYAQADWYMAGAEDFAVTYLQKITSAATPAALNAQLLKAEPFLFPLGDGGVLSLTVSDGSLCWPLGGLITDGGEPRGSGERELEAILIGLDIPPAIAKSITASATDWADIDSNISQNGGAEDYYYLGQNPAHRAANTNFTSAQELRVLPNMTEALYRNIRPFICAGKAGQQARLNVNTLTLDHAPLLAAMIGGDMAIGTAQAAITERPSGGYKGADQFWASRALAGLDLKSVSKDRIIYMPESFKINVELAYLSAVRRAVFTFEKDLTGQYAITQRSYGDEALVLAAPVDKVGL